MKTYASIIDLLNFEGPGLQDYVTTEELGTLIDGTLAPAVIADRYLDELDFTTVVTVETSEAETRADLLTWIRWEIETAIDQRKDIARDDAVTAKLNELQELAAAEERFLPRIRATKVDVARQAMTLGATKAAVADALGVSRPTLDAWLKKSE